MQSEYTASDAFAAAVDAEWARSGDVTALLRAAHVAGMSYGIQPTCHIARIALSGLVSDHDATLVLSLLNVRALEQQPFLFSDVSRHLAKSPAVSDLLAAMQADPTTSRTPVQSTLEAIRPSALDELKARMNPEPVVKEIPRAPKVPAPEPRRQW